MNYKEEGKIYVLNLLNYIAGLGYTHRQIAKKIGITEVSISRYFNGERCPNAAVLLKIYDEFNITDQQKETFKMTKEEKNICKNDLILSMLSDLRKLEYEYLLEVKKFTDSYCKLQEREKLLEDAKVLKKAQKKHL